MTDYNDNLPGLVVPKQLPPPETPAAEQPSTLEELKTSLSAHGVDIPRIRVVDESGRETVGELDVSLISMVTQLAQLGQMNKIRKSLARQEFQGKLLSVTLPATDVRQALDLTKQDPFEPFVTATFSNKGPNAVYIAINHQRPYHKLDKGDSLPADFTRADKRLYYIEYECDSGETATVRVLGKY